MAKYEGKPSKEYENHENYSTKNVLNKYYATETVMRSNYFEDGREFRHSLQ